MNTTEFGEKKVSDGWTLGVTEEGKTLFLPKVQPFAPESIEQRHKVALSAEEVLRLITKGSLTPENILTFKEWKLFILPYLTRRDKEFSDFYMRITPAFALGIKDGKVVMLGEGRLVGDDRRPIEGPGVMGIVKNVYEGQLYAEPEMETLIRYPEIGRNPLSIQLGFAQNPQFIKPATYYFSSLHFGFTCPILNEDRVVMNNGRKASVITVKRI